MKNDSAALIGELKSWGCQYTAIGGFFPNEPITADWHRFADEFNQAAANFAGSGIQLGYPTITTSWRSLTENALPNFAGTT